MSKNLLRPIAVLVLLLAVGCSGGANDPSASPDNAPSASPTGLRPLEVQVASYDLAVGDHERVIVGLLSNEQEFISYGTVDMEFFYLGKEQGQGTAQDGPEAEGTFVPIPGDPLRDDVSVPSISGPKDGRGVYEAFVPFDRAGNWAVQVTTEIDGRGEMAGYVVFPVLEKHQVPIEGEPALVTESLTLESDAPAQAIDSRAKTVAEIPDPELHELSLDEALKNGRPTAVVFSTPVYCVSRFCGPITDTVQRYQEELGNKVNFVHVEVWRDFEGQVLNKGAAEWLLHDESLQEPWVFLIDRNGEVVGRWDNVFAEEDFLTQVKKAL